MASWLKIKNWEKFQHYKDRCPPWIKLHYSIFNDYAFSCLQDASKLHLILIWLLASQLDNKVPADPKWLQGKLMVSKPVDFKPLIKAGFLVVIDDDSKVLAECLQGACLETETETETETDKHSASGDAVYISKKGKKLKGKMLADFELFWKKFDYRKGKAEAADAWYALSPDPSLTEKIIEAAAREAMARPKRIQEGRTPKMAQGWLSGRRWEDEQISPAASSKTAWDRKLA